MQKIDEQLRDEAGADETPLSLLALDMSGEQVKAAVAVGDVDHAQHVANFTPGMGTNVRNSLDNYVDVADRMRENTVEKAKVERVGCRGGGVVELRRPDGHHEDLGHGCGRYGEGARGGGPFGGVPHGCALVAG